MQPECRLLYVSMYVSMLEGGYDDSVMNGQRLVIVWFALGGVMAVPVTTTTGSSGQQQSELFASDDLRPPTMPRLRHPGLHQRLITRN